ILLVNRSYVPLFPIQTVFLENPICSNGFRLDASPSSQPGLVAILQHDVSQSHRTLLIAHFASRSEHLPIISGGGQIPHFQTARQISLFDSEYFFHDIFRCRKIDLHDEICDVRGGNGVVEGSMLSRLKADGVECHFGGSSHHVEESRGITDRSSLVENVHVSGRSIVYRNLIEDRLDCAN
ncbi:hypothetical protein PENTCL1PPCAC_7531, partial [Pristionchus entomophagus]